MNENSELEKLPIDDVLLKLGTSTSGLSAKEAENRLKIYGPNEIAERKKGTIIIRFLSHFKSPLVLILLFAGLISGYFGEIINTIIIFSMVFLSVILDFYQESKAEKASETLKKKVGTTATIVREGNKKEVKISEIVPGDIVLLSAGDIVPADARVINAKDLFLDQSALTGESFPVEKTAADCLFMGTSVISGTSMAVIIKTHDQTEYGKIAKSLAANSETNFEKELRKFGFLIMEITFVLVLFVFFILALYKHNITESLLFSVALAVGLTPELLPMIMSINLAKGAMAMSKKGAIVKRLSSVQNFGSMDVLCTDKTGTLTENKIKLVKHIDLEGNDDEKVLLHSFLNSYFETGLKDPLDEAILAYEKEDVKNYQKIDEVPFDFIRKRVSIIVSGPDQFMISKGAPEEIFKLCSSYELKGIVSELSIEELKKIEHKYNELSSQGFRVLAVAYKKTTENKVYSSTDETEMIFLGFVAFIDPPKETAQESLHLLMSSGIEVKVLTGDNDLVTKNICEQLNFPIKGIVLGADIAKMTDDALAKVVEEANIFARVTPAQKTRIINTLKKNGHVVGLLGDGINDAPSLKAADIGISVDNAVDVAKESADIILSQKSLKVLHDGVIEGRKTFGNTMKYIMMGTSSNFGNMFSVAIASTFLSFLPMLPIQILLNNLLYDVSESAIPTDNVDPEYLEKPKKMDISFIKKYMIIVGLISSLFDLLTFGIMLYIFNAAVPLFQTAWFIESLVTQVLVIFVIRTRMFYKSKPSKLLVLSSLSVILIAIAIPFTPVGKLFGFVAPPLEFFMVLGGMLLAYILLVEVVKNWFYKRYFYRLDTASLGNRN